MLRGRMQWPVEDDPGPAQTQLYGPLKFGSSSYKIHFKLRFLPPGARKSRFSAGGRSVGGPGPKALNRQWAFRKRNPDCPQICPQIRSHAIKYVTTLEKKRLEASLQPNGTNVDSGDSPSPRRCAGGVRYDFLSGISCDGSTSLPFCSWQARLRAR